MSETKTGSIIRGVIYSNMTEADLIPQIWVPNNLLPELVLKIIEKSSSLIKLEEDNWSGKISVLPIPVEKFLGLTYFFNELLGDSKETRIASITLLINESASDFLYRNMERFKKDLENLAQHLTGSKSHKQSIISQFHSNLIEFVERYQILRNLSDMDRKDEDPSQNCVQLSYFHSKLGPRVFYCYPENIITKKQQQLLCKELEISFEQSLYTKSYTDFMVVHQYFEIPSKWARGKVELCLISLIFEKMPSNELVNIVTLKLWELIDEITNKMDVFMGFYEEEKDERKETKIIEEEGEYLRNWVQRVHIYCMKEYHETSTEIKFARIMRDYNRVRILEKLEEGPINAIQLKNWASTYLRKEIDVIKLLEPLLEFNFVIKKSIMGRNHFVLQKGIRVIRILPVDTLEKLKAFKTVYPAIYPNLLNRYEKEVRNFLRKYRMSRREESFLASLIIDPVNYVIISTLRRKAVSIKTDLIDSLPENIRDHILDYLNFLRNHDVITEIETDNEIFVLLKTDIRFVTTIPKYVLLERQKKKEVPESLKEVLENVSEAPERIKSIFQRWFS